MCVIKVKWTFLRQWERDVNVIWLHRDTHRNTPSRSLKTLKEGSLLVDISPFHVHFVFTLKVNKRTLYCTVSADHMSSTVFTVYLCNVELDSAVAPVASNSQLTLKGTVCFEKSLSVWTLCNQSDATDLNVPIIRNVTAAKWKILIQ